MEHNYVEGISQPIWHKEDVEVNKGYRESRFDEVMQEIKPLLNDYANFDLVVGIPFVDEQEHLPQLLMSMDQVLKSWIGKRQLIVCVGDAEAGHILESIQKLQLHHPHIEFLLPPEISGRGTSIRALLQIANTIEADLIVFSAHMSSEAEPVLEDAWLDSLLTPIQGDYDMVLGSLRRYQAMDSIAHMLASPILESFYGARVGDPLGESMLLPMILWRNWIMMDPFGGKLSRDMVLIFGF